MSEVFKGKDLPFDVVYTKGEDGFMPAVTLKTLRSILNRSAGSVSLYTKKDYPLPVETVQGINLVPLKGLFAYKWASKGRGLIGYISHIHPFKDGSFRYVPCKACTSKFNLGDMGTGECGQTKGYYVDNEWAFEVDDD